MKDVIIVTEGKSDIKFLQDYVEEHFSLLLPLESFIDNSSNSLTQATSVNNIRLSIDSGKEVLLIFDADNPDYDGTLKYLKEQKKKFSLEFKTFLFPNNKDKGNLEMLLRSIVSESKKPVFACIEQYSSCLSKTNIEHLRNFDIKAQMYVFVDSFDIGGKGKEEKRNYREKELWNLHHNYLLPLRDFLTPYFAENVR